MCLQILGRMVNPQLNNLLFMDVDAGLLYTSTYCNSRHYVFKLAMILFGVIVLRHNFYS